MSLPAKTYIDLKYGFEKNSSGDTSPIYNESSINQSLMTLFLTNKGERFFNPTYGTDIKKLLFEPLDTITANAIINEMDTAVKFWESQRIQIVELNITIDYDNNTYRVLMTYLILSTTETATLNVALPKV